MRFLVFGQLPVVWVRSAGCGLLHFLVTSRHFLSWIFDRTCLMVNKTPGKFYIIFLLIIRLHSCGWGQFFLLQLMLMWEVVVIADH